MTKLINIYAEGARYTGGSSPAQLLGSGRGETFIEACEELATRDKDFAQYYSNGRYWGCKLYDNLGDAQVNFG